MEDQPIKSDKAVKISIIAGALLLILLMAFYFIYYLPSRKHKLENTSVRTENNISKATGMQENSTGSIEAVTPSDAELKQYYASYKDPFVLQIRKALNGYLAGTNEGMESPDIVIKKDDLNGSPSGLASFDKEYYKSKFVVLAIDDALFGGKDISIIFQDKPDIIFTAWVYKFSDVHYDLRGFWEDDKATENIDLALKTFGKYIFDKEHSL